MNRCLGHGISSGDCHTDSMESHDTVKKLCVLSCIPIVESGKAERLARPGERTAQKKAVFKRKRQN